MVSLNKKVPILFVSVLIVLLVGYFFISNSSSMASFDTKFENELNAKLETLIAELKDFDGGTKPQPMIITTAEKTFEKQVETAKSQIVVNAAKDIRKHMHSLTLDILLREENELEKFISDVKLLYASKLKVLITELDRIKEDYKNNKHKYSDTSPLSIYSGGKTIDIDKNDELLFIESGGTRGHYVEREVKIDLDRWSNTIRKMSKKYRGNK